jgi:hypothetical protein
MDLRPMNRARRRDERRSRGVPVRSARRGAGALALGGLCIVAFECSQLVYHTASCPAWADARALIARASTADPGPAARAEAGPARPLPA